jgi:hypothetical protein
VGRLYQLLTTPAHHHGMKIRDNMSAVIAGLQKDHGLLAAFLEATDKIDWRALNKQVVISRPPEPANVEAQELQIAPHLPDAEPSSSFTFRRANLVRAARAD